MPVSSPVQDDVRRLKERTLVLERRVAALEKAQGILPEEVKPSTELSAKTREGSGNERTGGIILTIIGAILSFTIVLAIIGLPLLIWGIYLLVKSSRKPGEAAAGRKTVVKKGVYAAVAKPDSSNFEQNVGLKWFSRIGILALVIGVGYFIKYAFDNNWINYLGRIAIGVAIGLGLVVFGGIMSRKDRYLAWARALSGGGFAIMYFAVYAAYHFEEYRDAIGLSEVADIALLTLIVVAAVAVSLKDNSRIVAGEAFFLGFVTVLLSRNFEFLTLVYGLLLTFGIVAVVSLKKWASIGVGGVAASYVLYLLWHADNMGNFPMATFFLLSSFLAYSAQSFFLRNVMDKASKVENVFAMLLNSAFFFLSYYAVIEASYPSYKGLFTLLLSVFYIAFYYFAGGGKSGFRAASLYLGLLYLTLAVPVQLNREWVTVIWALEAVVLTVLAINLGMPELRFSSYAVGVFTAAKAVFYDFFFLHKLDFSNLLGSTRLVSVLFTVVCFYFICLLLRKNIGEAGGKEARQEFAAAAAFYSLAATFFLSLIILVELIDHLEWVTILWAVLGVVLTVLAYRSGLGVLWAQSFVLSSFVALKALLFDSWRLGAFDASDVFGSTRFFALIAVIVSFYASYGLMKKGLARASGKESGEALSSGALLYSWGGTFFLVLLIGLELSSHSDWITVLWSAISVVLLLLTFNRSLKELNYPAFFLSAAVAFKVLFVDISLGEFNPSNFLESARIFAFLSAIVAFYFISDYFEKIKGRLDETEQAAHQVYSWTATSMMAILIFLEMSGFWISVGWALFAISILAAGFYLGRKRLRLQGIALLFLTISKVFLYDTRELSALYRTTSFIVLGVILLAASFIYAKYKEKISKVL